MGELRRRFRYCARGSRGSTHRKIRDSYLWDRTTWLFGLSKAGRLQKLKNLLNKVGTYTNISEGWI